MPTAATTKLLGGGCAGPFPPLTSLSCCISVQALYCLFVHSGVKEICLGKGIMESWKLWQKFCRCSWLGEPSKGMGRSILLKSNELRFDESVDALAQPKK